MIDLLKVINGDYEEGKRLAECLRKNYSSKGDAKHFYYITLKSFCMEMFIKEQCDWLEFNNDYCHYYFIERYIDPYFKEFYEPDFIAKDTKEFWELKGFLIKDNPTTNLHGAKNVIEFDKEKNVFYFNGKDEMLFTGYWKEVYEEIREIEKNDY